MENCRVCEAEVAPEVKFCPQCGAKYPLSDVARNQNKGYEYYYDDRGSTFVQLAKLIFTIIITGIACYIVVCIALWFILDYILYLFLPVTEFFKLIFFFFFFCVSTLCKSEL